METRSRKRKRETETEVEAQHRMQKQNPSRLLPEDVLADILRRLPPRSLAVSRCVCKEWRAVIDTRRILRADLLPHSLAGILINFEGLKLTEFFRRDPSATTTQPVISGDLTSYSCSSPSTNISVLDHCNGLLLLRGCVVNPATRQWERLPPLQLSSMPSRTGTEAPAFYSNFHTSMYLVFDPAVSPHRYEVFVKMHVSGDWKNHLLAGSVAEPESAEWPPPRMMMYVFSSTTGRWGERWFDRQGGAAGTIAEAHRHYRLWNHYGVYLRGALYVHCRNHFFCRISLSEGTYQVIRPPPGVGINQQPEIFLGKSQNQVRCALKGPNYRFRVWVLDEESFKWKLKHRVNLEHQLAHRWHSHLQPVEQRWILQDINYCRHRRSSSGSNHQHDDDDEEEESEWWSEYITFLGFHPFEDVVFLGDTTQGGMACDLRSLSVQYLGKLRPRENAPVPGPYADVWSSFPYTPCWMGELFQNK